jgi:hypothetical protein
MHFLPFVYLEAIGALGALDALGKNTGEPGDI